MLFSSLVFLFLFLPIVLMVYFVLKNEYRNLFLLLASLFFYAWGEPSFVIVMVASIIINYCFGICIYSFEKQKKVFLTIGIICNLSLLVYFKYFAFLFLPIANFYEYIGFIPSKFLIQVAKDIVLPIGISFFTFQGMSYLIDIYRGVAKVQTNFINLALYIALFPQLIAGPIVRYNTISEQISTRTVSLIDFSEGLRLFMVGLGKKVIIANSVGQTADIIFKIPFSNLDSPTAWLGIICYTFQIYFDFSGYSDMAIGIGKMFGFKFPINFNYPYISKSMTEFWRRWHISLSSWFKDYLYIPLGGNRMPIKRVYLNLLIVFTATGLWHGANLTFLVWGLWHGFFLIIEKKILSTNLKLTKLFIPVAHLYTILVFMIGWVVFRSEAIDSALKFIKIMFVGNSKIPLYELYFYLNNFTITILILACFASTPIFTKLHQIAYVKEILAIIIFIISVVLIANSTFNPFLYFRF